MLTKQQISKENFPELRQATAKKREDVASQDEALADIRELKAFAIENEMKDDAVELFLEEALAHQHLYMENQDQKYLESMKEAVNQANVFVQTKNLPQWESRLARFLGRIADYNKDYEAAAGYYQEAIAKVSLDPKYSGNPAMGYEYKGFLVLDQLRLGDIASGISAALNLYRDYEETSEGQELKANDYTTWAIWRTAILINLSRTLIDLGKLAKYREKVVEWLALAEKDLNPPVETKVWSDFGFRKNEIAKVRETL